MVSFSFPQPLLKSRVMNKYALSFFGGAGGASVLVSRLGPSTSLSCQPLILVGRRCRAAPIKKPPYLRCCHRKIPICQMGRTACRRPQVLTMAPSMSQILFRESSRRTTFFIPLMGSSVTLVKNTKITKRTQFKNAISR
jgi:hypothetical protein